MGEKKVFMVELATPQESILILSMKRSGSTWAQDVLAPLAKASVNEPLALYNNSDYSNPLNPWNYSSRVDVSREYGHRGLEDKPLASLVTRSFIEWLGEGGKLIKETDFLYADWLLESAPLKTLVLERDPRDSIASYERWGLYDWWRLDDRMVHLSTTIQANPDLDSLYGDLAFSLKSNMPEHQKLAIYYAIGISEIARITKDKDIVKIAYEDLVADPIVNFREVAQALGLPWSPQVEKIIIAKTSPSKEENPYGTSRSKGDLTTFAQILTSRQEADIRGVFGEFGISLIPPKGAISPILNGSATEKKHRIDTIGFVDRNEDIANAQANSSNRGRVSNALVTNREYARFLQWMGDNGIPQMIDGVPFLYKSRGAGNIFNSTTDIYVDLDHAEEPVNFISWVGANLYAGWIGGKLPQPPLLTGGETSLLFQRIVDEGIRVVFDTDPLSDREYLLRVRNLLDFTKVHHENVTVANRQLFSMIEELTQ